MRGAWGAAGDALAVVSDCGAIREIWKDYWFTKDNESAVAAALHGGCDFECGGTFNDYVVKALDRGDIVLADLQQAARRMLRLAFRAGMLDPVERQLPYLSLNAESVDTPQSRQLAFEAAVQSIVLLQNRAPPAKASAQPLLPLRSGALRRLAVVGPNANVTATLLGSYHGENRLVTNQSVLAALQRRGARDGFGVAFAPGCANISCADASGFAAATAAAAGADAAVVVLGLCSDDCPGGDADGGVSEGEGKDRPSTDLPGLQEQLLRAVVGTGTPTVLLLVHGGPLSIDWPAANVDAILSIVYPGEFGGDAAAAILFGDASPSGRSTMTWYSTEWQKQRPFIVDMGLAPRVGVLGEVVTGVTYLYANASLVLYPFGTGESYARFSFAWSDGGAPRALSARELVAAPPSFEVNVTNIGSVASDVSALAFVSSGAPGEPAHKCFDFARASALAPGASALLVFTLPPDVAATVSAEGEQAVVPGAYAVRVGELSRELVVTGVEGVVLFDMPAVRRSAGQASFPRRKY